MLEFRTNIDHDIPDSLYGDSISLKESLNKILKNSLNNTNTGYIEFNVNTIIKNDVCRLIITIEDSSNGIQSEELNTIKNDNKLLSEANSLIGVMNGTMMISSDFGVGTKIKVILDQKIVDSENKEVTKYVSTLDNVNVLVCDTESGLKVISKLLDDSNIKLDKVDNGKELLESIKENKYDLVLMDESTSTNNQILVSKMRNVRNFNSEIILLTRDNNYEYSDEYKNLGFDDYILKPLKKDILLEKINKYKD
jgi:CheY-like chemotaxis protein